jgi:hypothetical protein
VEDEQARLLIHSCARVKRCTVDPAKDIQGALHHRVGPTQHSLARAISINCLSMGSGRYQGIALGSVIASSDVHVSIQRLQATAKDRPLTHYFIILKYWRDHTSIALKSADQSRAHGSKISVQALRTAAAPVIGAMRDVWTPNDD